MRIGILGGTFDPIHKGHLTLAKSALHQLQLDRLYFVPTKKSPFKLNQPSAPIRRRMEMLRAEIKGMNRTFISDEELHRPAPSYTIDTLRHFAQNFPESELFLIMGTDTLAGFCRWKKWKEVLGLCKLAVAVRKGTPISKKNFTKVPRDKIIWLKSQMPIVSSTQIRIEREIVPYLKKRLPPERFRHVQRVIQFAEKLSQRHGISPEKAKLSAALHDLARCWIKKKLVQYVKGRRLTIPAKKWAIKNQPVLLHSYVSADLAKRRFKVRDKEILNAIAKHTLADLSMSSLDKLIFLADLVAEERSFPGVQKLRKLALRSLDLAFIEGLRSKMEYLLKNKNFIHPRATLIWNRFVRESLK